MLHFMRIFRAVLHEISPAIHPAKHYTAVYKRLRLVFGYLTDIRRCKYWRRSEEEGAANCKQLSQNFRLHCYLHIAQNTSFIKLGH